MPDPLLKDRILNIGRRLGRPDILFCTLPWLMVLIVVGTIMQKYVGLYAAQNTYFSAFIWWFHGIPLPAGYSVLGVMTINLLCKFCFASVWTRDKTGIHIIHFSIILLMVGGLMTALTMNEGYIALKAGESSAEIRDYHDRVLVLTSDNDRVMVPFEEWGNADIIASLPIPIKIEQICQNTAIQPRKIKLDDAHGAASMAELVCVPSLIDQERNVAGMTYRILDGADAGLYIVFDGRQTSDDVNGYTIRVDRAMRDLPFTIALQSFRRDVYPGTNMPREYESRVTVTEGDVVWPAMIAMNEPLRSGGYTFYQASTMIDEDGAPVSVLSVVKNTGWLFPYFSGIFLAVGLIVHLIIRIRKAKA